MTIRTDFIVHRYPRPESHPEGQLSLDDLFGRPERPGTRRPLIRAERIA